jgi:hypothetical protein
LVLKLFMLDCILRRFVLGFIHLGYFRII